MKSRQFIAVHIRRLTVWLPIAVLVGMVLLSLQKESGHPETPEEIADNPASLERNFDSPESVEPPTSVPQTSIAKLPDGTVMKQNGVKTEMAYRFILDNDLVKLEATEEVTETSARNGAVPPGSPECSVAG